MWNKTKRAFDVMKVRNDRYIEKMNEDSRQDEDGSEEEAIIRQDDVNEEKDLGLEKGDIPALIISAFLTFSPIFLVLGLIVYLAWTFLH